MTLGLGLQHSHDSWPGLTTLTLLWAWVYNTHMTLGLGLQHSHDSGPGFTTLTWLWAWAYNTHMTLGLRLHSVALHDVLEWLVLVSHLQSPHNSVNHTISNCIGLMYPYIPYSILFWYPIHYQLLYHTVLTIKHRRNTHNNNIKNWIQQAHDSQMKLFIGKNHRSYHNIL